jgi:hypothetical protein
MQPNTARMPGEALSPTQASTYLGCSAKWWFRYGLAWIPTELPELTVGSDSA